MTDEDKRQLADDFLTKLDTHIANKVSDGLPSDGYDSYAGMASFSSGQKLEKALYRLLEISFEENIDDDF